ncbi:MAG: (2Fe-2S)-binding protein [bacterium]
MEETIQFTLNKKPVSVTTDSDRKLLWVLRTDLALTGAKYGCGIGMCGCCTVLVGDESVRSCQTPLKAVAGKKVTTIEGLANGDTLHPLQKAFVEHDALQCGYCTSGIILSAFDLLQRKPRPTESEILQGMDGNLCRCGSHVRVVQAIQSAAAEMRGERS